MRVLVMTLRLRAPWCQSLKDKRAALRPVLLGLRRRFNVSAAESGLQDAHQLMEITLALLVHSAAQGDSLREQVLQALKQLTEAEVYGEEAEYL